MEKRYMKNFASYYLREVLFFSLAIMKLKIRAKSPIQVLEHNIYTNAKIHQSKHIDIKKRRLYDKITTSPNYISLH
jgi:hypothetical protein